MKQIRKRTNNKGGKTALSPAKARKEQWKNDIVTLYLQGNSMRQVNALANEQTGHNFSLKTICKYINDAVDEWKENKTQLIDNHKAIEVAKINNMEAEYWNAWVRSCQVHVVKSRTRKKADEANRLAVFQTKEDERQGIGDPRFLQGMQWCVEMRCKILGVEVPQPIVQVNTNQSNSTTIIRRVVFKTRELTAAPQIITQVNPDYETQN